MKCLIYRINIENQFTFNRSPFFIFFFWHHFFLLGKKKKIMQDFNFADQSNFVSSCTLRHARDVTCFVFATMRVQDLAHFCPFLLTVHVVRLTGHIIAFNK